MTARDFRERSLALKVKVDYGVGPVNSQSRVSAQREF